jgi:hypothetical protein
MKSKLTEEWPIPKDIKRLGGFLVLTGYYRKFVKDYETIARPLIQLLKNSFHWGEEAMRASKRIKRVMIELPMLSMPNFQRAFEIELMHLQLGMELFSLRRRFAASTA